jgi:hypothetical protein
MGEKKPMTSNEEVLTCEFHRWRRSFKAAAHSDNYALLLDHMIKLGFPPEPKLMLEGTISVMAAVLAYARIDGHPFDQFLELQKYDPSQATDARYTFTFDLCGKSYARILVNSKLETIDLADLFNHPWDDYKVAGYDRIWISHPDWSHLANEELQQLEEYWTEDLLFDYSEDELNFRFEAGPDESFLLVGDVFELRDLEEGEDPDHC